MPKNKSSLAFLFFATAYCKILYRKFPPVVLLLLTVNSSVNNNFVTLLNPLDSRLTTPTQR